MMQLTNCGSTHHSVKGINQQQFVGMGTFSQLKERRISDLGAFDINIRNYKQNSSPNSQSNDSSTSNDQNTVKSSARVLQLKREIDDLDAQLMRTNTVNFDEMRTSMLRDAINNNPSTDFSKSSGPGAFPNDLAYLKLTGVAVGHHSRSRAAFELESSLLPRHSLGNSSLKQLQSQDRHQQMDLRGSVQIYHQIQNNAAAFQSQKQLNMSHLTQDEVSFDIDKIQAARNLNLQTALESNLQEKKDRIGSLKQQISQLQKECEAKNLKLTHLRFERENIINQLQVEAIKKQEQAKEAREQLKRIDVKKSEDERAQSFAQNEIKRNINEQQTAINEILDHLDNLEEQLAQMQGKSNLVQSSNSKTLQAPLSNELAERIAQQEYKLKSLQQKKCDIDKNLGILKNFLKTISEEIQMTQEDLSGKLLQRAEFVAQREELDQMYDSGRMAFGKCFEIYLKINDGGITNGSQSSRFLHQDYENEKTLSFFSSLLQQIKQSTKSKVHERIDEVYQEIENLALTNLDIDKSLDWIVELAQSLNLQLDKQVLFRHLNQQSEDKDLVYAQRHQQLNDIISEIRRFERLIKENANLVDNMILPQLKAMSATYNEHKGKYRKLKQASFVIRERVKKAEKDMVTLQEDMDRQASDGTQIRLIENQIQAARDQLGKEKKEMDRLIENKEQIEKEYRRAQQALALKEREILSKLEATNAPLLSQSITSLNATQISILSNQRQQEMEDERMRKRFSEIEDKIRDTLIQKEEAEFKLDECRKQLLETEESCEHAENIVMTSQRSLNQPQVNQYKRRDKQSRVNTEQNINNVINGEDDYQITSFTDNDQLPADFPNNPQKLTLSNLKSSARHRQTNTVIPNMILEQQEQEKENLGSKSMAASKFKTSKESLTKLDLSKIMQYKDSYQPSTYSGQRSTSNYNNYEMINYDKMTQSQHNTNQLKINSKHQDSTTLADISQSSIHPGTKQSQNRIKRQESSKNQFSDLNMFNADEAMLLQQSLNNGSNSVMNLSDLIIQNNPAIQNILNLAHQQQQQQNQIDRSVYNASRHTFSNNTSTAPMMMRQSYSSLSTNQLPQRDHHQSQYNLQSSHHHQQNMSSAVDQSLLQYLEDMNYQSQIQEHPPVKKGIHGLRRTSVETADFLHEDLQRAKQMSTIDVDLTNRNQLEQSTLYNMNMPVSPDIQNAKNRIYLNRMANQNINQGNTQSVQYNSNNNAKVRQSSKSGWMQKYLNSGNEFSRMYGSGLQQSVSPDTYQRRGTHDQQNIYNRPSSFERYRVTNPRLNISTNSIGSIGNYNTVHEQSSYVQEGMNHSRSVQRLTKKNRKLNKSMNGVESSALLHQSIASSQMNPVTMSVNFGHNLSCAPKSGQFGGCSQMNHGPECIQFSKVDVSFAERIVPLLDGAAFYKKFSSRQSLNENAFDPLNSDKFPPESCGYGIRLFQLDKSLLCINVRMSLKIAVETTIPLNDIVKPILPQTTMDIIKAQKQFMHHNHCGMRKSSRNGQLISQSLCNINSIVGNPQGKDLLEEFLILESKGSISHLAKIGIVNKNSELYRQKCLESQFYPFSIALTNGRVELIATSYETLKNWIIGINLLVSYKKHIPKLKQLMELKLD